MGRSRYKIYEPTYPHFTTCTILHWIPVFTNKESVEIIIESLKNNLKLYAYVILENHIHLIVQSDDIANDIGRFKSFTARKFIDLLKEMLELFWIS